MFEVPKKLLNKWNRRLKQEGLPEELKPTKIPLVPLSNKEALLMLAPEIKQLFLSEFLDLQDEIQKDIIADLEAKKEAGMREEDILKRLCLLVEYGHYLSVIDGEDSDKRYKPKLSNEELKLMEEMGWVPAGVDEKPELVDEYVERMEVELEPETTKKIH